MNTFVDIKRRKFLQYAGISTASLAMAPHWLWAGNNPENSAQQFQDQELDVEIALTAQVAGSSILPGPPTEVWKFSAKLLKGPQGTVEEMPGAYLGPILRLRQGQKVRIHFHNKVPERSTRKCGDPLARSRSETARRARGTHKVLSSP